MKVAHERGCGVDELGVSVERLAQLVEGGSVSASAAAIFLQDFRQRSQGPIR